MNQVLLLGLGGALVVTFGFAAARPELAAVEPARMLVIGAEERMLVIGAEARALIVGAEDRTLASGSELRTLNELPG